MTDESQKNTPAYQLPTVTVELPVVSLLWSSACIGTFMTNSPASCFCPGTFRSDRGYYS